MFYKYPNPTELAKWWSCADPEGGGGVRVLKHSGKLQVAIGFLKKCTCTDPPRDAIGQGPIASRGRSVRP